MPVLDDTLAWLLCRVVDRVVVGDHAVVLAEPELLWHADVGSPLLCHRGRYAGLADTTDPGDRRCAA
ncbi:flavin reductase family protein [Micromonospora chalcea]|uniref:flavin reductase family protein n=1 Tax=Micromonospora chalcea TaxID=1874 RepID=UPI001FC8FA30|nr:flavin reductase family protein [Micromonospora chalcea]